MGFSTKLRLIKEKFEQLSGDSLILSGNTEFADSADVRYTTHPTFVDDEQIVDKKYVDDHVQSGTTASLYYTGETPSNITVGGMPSGDVLTGRTLSNIIEDMTHTYYAPTFSAFNIGVSTPKEVGYSMPSTSNATWSTLHSENVKDNSIDIVDETANSTLASGLANDGAETVNLISKTYSPSGGAVQSNVWRIDGTNTNNVAMTSRKYTMYVYQPYFYGISSDSSRPTAGQTLLNSGTKVIANPNGTLSMNLNTPEDVWLWFAIPSSVANKTNWFFTDQSKGTIGDGGATLFPDISENISVDDPNSNWSGVTYDFYVTGYKTNDGGEPLKVSNTPLINVYELLDMINALQE